jgi:catechol 2,3-dioxygenase-like lactoylglutathione lyase family enzyme
LIAVAAASERSADRPPPDHLRTRAPRDKPATDRMPAATASSSDIDVAMPAARPADAVHRSTLPGMIAGAHTILYARDAEAARAFFRDVLGLDCVDSGGGWLIFALPPGELACHPGSGTIAGREEGHTELFLMCQDVDAARRELEGKGVEFVAPVTNQGYGLMTRFSVPGFGELGLYEPRHASPLAEFG